MGQIKSTGLAAGGGVEAEVCRWEAWCSACHPVASSVTVIPAQSEQSKNLSDLDPQIQKAHR